MNSSVPIIKKDLGPELDKRMFPKKYENAHVSNFRFGDEVNKKIMLWVNQCDNFLIFLGRAGCGKTYFCCALAHYIYENKTQIKTYNNYKHIEKKGKRGAVYEVIPTSEICSIQQIITHKRVIYLNISTFYESFKKKYQKKESDENLKKTFQAVDYLILDDLGASANTEWQVAILYEILDYRYANLMPTIITSNFTFDEIENIFHSRIRSRLEDEANFVYMDWETDYRTGKGVH